jgi:hypothetical protein
MLYTVAIDGVIIEIQAFNLDELFNNIDLFYPSAQSVLLISFQNI